jgi:triphosphatase
MQRGSRWLFVYAEGMEHASKTRGRVILRCLIAEFLARIAPVFDALGAVRDRQVFLKTIAPSLRRAGYRCIDPADALPSIDEGQIATLVRASAFTDALASLDAYSRNDDPEANGLDGLQPAGKWLRKRLRRLQRCTRRDGRRFSKLPFEQQHAVRKRLKRIQYLSHFFAPRVHHKTYAACQKRADELLAALGRHIDLCQAARAFQAVASPKAQTWFAIGWLRAKQDESARASQRLLEDLGRPLRV